jgi:hypothetical protein
VNESVQEIRLSPNDLFQIFSALKKFWENGSKIQIILPMPRSVTFVMLANELGFPPNQLSSVINFRIGKRAFAPIYVLDDNEMVIKVATTPNAIGYVPGKIGVGSGFGLRVIKIQ